MRTKLRKTCLVEQETCVFDANMAEWKGWPESSARINQEISMAKLCPITGKRPMAGNKVSHANNKTRRRWEPNLQWKRIWVPAEKKFIRMRVSARGLRTINKLGVEAALLSVKG